MWLCSFVLQGTSTLLKFHHAGHQNYMVGVGESYTDLQFRWPVALQYGTGHKIGLQLFQDF